MHWSLDDIPVFAAIVRFGGITAAAQGLGRPKSTISTALARLEDAIGVRLLNRTSRSVQLTPEGEQFYAHCLGILDQVKATEAAVNGLSVRPAGRLTVAMPSAFGREIVAPALPGFINAYPEIDLELTMAPQWSDIDQTRFDIAVMVGEIADSTMTCRVLLQGRLIWVASPEYCANLHLETLDDLAPHIKACETRYANRRIDLLQSGQTRHLTLPRNVIRMDDPLALRIFIENGGGISFLPERYCQDALANGDLVEVASEVSFVLGASVLSAIFPTRDLLSPRIRVFLDFLVSVCTQRSDRGG